jgi:hypothetical protein
VVLAGTRPAVDEAATRAMRAEMRAMRRAGDVPIYNWGERLAAE